MTYSHPFSRFKLRIKSSLVIGAAVSLPGYVYFRVNALGNGFSEICVFAAVVFFCGMFWGWVFDSALNKPGTSGIMWFFGSAYLISALTGILSGSIFFPGLGSIGGLIASTAIFFNGKIFVAWFFAFAVARLAILAMKRY